MTVDHKLKIEELYTGVDLTQYTAVNGNKYTYTYNAKHDILTATAAGIKNTYTYDTSGNATSSKLTSTDTTNTAYLYSSATMSDDRNHTLSVTDTAGKTTTYDYNKYYHFLNSTTNANNVTTNYAYFTGNGRMQQTYQSGVAAVTYTYSGGQLSSLDRKTFRNGAEQHQYYNFAYNLWGQNTSISVGSTELASYEYEAINSAAAGGGNLTKMTYGNDASVSYTYDEFDRLVKTVYNDTGNYILYAYNAEGAVARLTYKSSANATLADYSFEYDSLGRLIRSAQYGANSVLAQRTEHLYDEYNRLYIQRWDIGGKTRSEKYTYDDRANGDGSLTQFKAGSGHKINYNYDPLRRLGNASVTNSSGTELFKTAYAYAAVSSDQTSTRVEYRNVRTTAGDLIFGYKYAYDNLGNITMISQSQSPFNPLVEYTYDSQNQLVKEVHYDGTGNTASHITDTYTYTYDTAGNIISETKTSGGTTTSKNYTYGNSNWRDLLTKVGNTTINYDSSGNPENYHNGNKTYTNLTWQHGRQLTSITVDGATASYAYDMDGIRSQKLVDGVLHSYVTQNGKVVRESFPYGDTTIIMDFIYDEAGRPFCVAYSKNGGESYTNYFYAVNAQGDVEGIFRVTKNDETGKYEQKWYGRYVYDAWGNVTATTAAGGKPSATSLVVRNPIRYRGYYYDTETGFYYLQSRYYDPVTHRFINADSYASTGQGIIGTNMFSYCNNSPIGSIDQTGSIPSRSMTTVSIFDGGGLPYIDDQESTASTYWPLGESTMGKTGCGIIAVYNILKSRWVNVSLSDVYNQALVLNTLSDNGRRGTTFDGMIEVLRHFDSSCSTPNTYISDAQSVLILYGFYDASGTRYGGHYVAAIRREKGQYIVYNDPYICNEPMSLNLYVKQLRNLLFIVDDKNFLHIEIDRVAYCG